MPKQLTVDLSVNANTTKAKAEIQKLQQELYKISNMSMSNNGLSSQIQEASSAAKELAFHLNQAYNSSTGNIDLSKLNTSLQKSGTNVQLLSDKLLGAGTIGQSAFINLANAISKADYPMFKLNSKLTEMWTTLKNTARWQLSSSMLHGFMGAVQQATSYAQKLDSSLNNIRIVTGMSNNEMDKFAESANRAAKALSTTTTEYTNASLIFFQQGLSSSEVEERTAVTIKMAQAAGENATEVSSYMTAIWNNFEGGKETLEGFGDSMVRLGADTAASSAEIASGLEKFAAIGETVGLSFDYAAAAATTIIDKTRESSETVGVALKTIFARMQGLKLGETLEDGVDLNKYSEALESVGVEVLDLNGNLRDADDILIDLGDTWDNLTRAQQMALAQTVAGTRQYTHLMSLMNNFDSFLENVNLSKNADGSLAEQAEIAADSWEKAQKRVQAAAEGIYESLIDRNFMKNYNNVLADVLTGIDRLIEGFGGLGGIISVAGSFILSMISHKIQPAIQNLVLNIQNLFTSTQTRAQQLVSSMQTKTKNEISTGKYDTSQTQSLRNSSLLAEARARLTVESKRLSDQERQLAQIDIANIEMQSRKAQAIADTVSNLEKEIDTLIIASDVTDSNTESTRIYNQMLKEQREMSQEAFNRAMSNEGTGADLNEYLEAEQAIAELQDRKMVLNEVINDSVSILLQDYEAMKRAGEGVSQFEIHTEQAIQPWKNLMDELKAPEDASSLNSYKSALEMISKSMPSVMKQSKEIQTALKNAFDASTPEAFNTALDDVSSAFDSIIIDGKNIGKVIRELNPKSFQELELILKKLKKEEQDLKTVNEELINSLNNFKPEHLITGVERLSSAAAAMGQVAMIGSSISSIINALNSQDMSFGERLSTILMSVSMIIPGVISSLSSLGHALEGTAAKEAIVSTVMKITNKDRDIAAAKTILLTKAKTAELTVDQTATIVKGSLAAAIKAEGLSVSDNTLNVMKLVVAKKIQNGATEEEIASWIASKLGCDADTAAKIANKIATDSLKTSISSLLGPIALVVAAMGLLIGVIKAYNKAQEEKAQKERDDRSDQIDSIMEEAEAYKTAREEYQELLKVYNEAVASSDGTAQAQKAIADATWDLCEALGIEIDYLDRLQGKTEGYNKKILEKNVANATTGLDNAKANKATVDTGLVDAYYDKGVKLNTPDDDMSNSINVIGDYKNYSPSVGKAFWEKEDKKIKEYINEFLQSDFQNKDKMAVDTISPAGSLNFKAEASNAEIYEIIDQMVTFLREKTKEDDSLRNNSEIFQWYDDIVKYGKEAYGKVAEINADTEKYIEDYAINQTQIDTEMMFQEIETAEEYNKMRQQLIENIYAGYEKLGYTKETGLPLGDFESETELITSLVDKYIANYDNLMNLESLEDVAKKTNIPIEEIEDLFADYSDVFFDASIQFDENLSKENLENTLKLLQGEADAQKIQTKIETVSTAKSKLKKNMTVSDYGEFETESGINWGKTDETLEKDIISYGQFLALSYEQQVQYLEQLEQAYLMKQASTVTAAIENARKLLTDYDTELKELTQKQDDGTATDADSERIAELKGLIENIQAGLPELQGAMQSINMSILSTATSFDDLQAKMNQIKEAGGIATLTDYGAALVSLAEKYDNCTQEIEQWNQALLTGDENMQAAAADALAGAVIIGEAAEKYGFEAENLEAQAKRLAKAYDLSAEEAARLAVKNQRMNKGVKTLTDNWKDWKKVLNKTDKLTTDYADAVVDVTAAIADLVGASEDLELPDEFFNDENMKLIEKAAKGDINAINQLGAAVATTTVEAMEFQQALADLAISAWELDNLEVDPEISSDWAKQFDTDKNTVLTGIQQIQSGAITSGDAMNSEWVAALNRMALATGMSVQEMNGLLGSLGVQAKVTTTYVKQPMEVPTYTDHYESVNYNPPEYDENGEMIRPASWSQKKYTVPGEPYTVEGYAAVAQISTDDNPLTLDIEENTVSGSAPAATYSGNRGPISPTSTEPSGKNKKGGGSDPKKTEDERGKKSDYVKRYEEIEDKLDNIRDAMEMASKKADRLWGPARLKQMKAVNGMLLEEIDLLEQQADEARAYLDEDQAAVKSTGAALGLNFTFDEKSGDITNIESQLTALFNSREALLDSFGAEMDEKEQETLEALDKKIEKFQDALDQYRETKEKVEDLEKERQEKIYEWQDNNYEQLNYKLEFEIEINESELEKIDYYLGKIEGNIYAASEAWGYMGQQVDTYTDSLSHQNEYAKQLEADYYAGKISMEAYKEGLRNCQSATIENLQALQEQKKAMQEYYGEVMEMAIEEITIYTDEMENLNSVLDHYSSILDLVGKKEDYATKKKILNSKATNLRNEMQVQKNIYEESSAEAEKWAEKMANAVVGSNEYETYKKNWQAAQQAANDAQDAMLSKTEEWAETMKLVIENEFAELADIMEESITGGTSFNELLTSMERRSSLQEEYLTTTNQIYETNKMMRTAQQEIDKTSNSVAKRRLKSFIDETAQMQNQTKLSKYELDIQQAKYDLLLAEIALEEAQNSKSTVRLQRDSEGNFGYVYTADQDAVNNAEQNLADKQNALYNIGLEGANNYSQKYAETLQEAQDAITELTEMWMNGEIESEEEYQRRKAEIQEYYYEKLKQYSGLYQVALTTDSNVIKDAWSTDFNDMIYQTENWKDAVDDYFAGAAESMQEWTEVCNTALQESGLDDVNKVIGEIDDKSQKLTTTLIGEDGESGVVGAMMAEVEAAGLLSEQYISIQNEIDNVITKYEELLEELNKKYTDPNTPVVEPKLPDDNPPADNPPTDDDKGKKYDKTTKRGVALAIWNGAYGWGVGKERRKKLKEKGFDPDEIQALVNNTNPSGGWETRYGITDLKKYAYSKFDTGGYTGDWNGPDGKFAMLHKKELVLNEQDTENFLAGMNILDKIVSIIDLYSVNSSLGGMLSSPSLGAVSSGSETLEQSVRIEASFPNVTERNEIEEAFTNLINKASQFANRK